MLLLVGMPALHAAAGPDPLTWIPTASTQTVGSLTVRIQNQTLYARDVQRLFVTALPGQTVQIASVSNTGGGSDYFDQTKDNGLYAIFGAVNPGTLTITLQTAPTGTTTWTTQGSINLTVNPKRVLGHDTQVDITAWYNSYKYNSGTITTAQMTALLDHDFADMAARGFTKVSMDWRPVNNLPLLFAKASQYNLKIMFECWNTSDWIKSGAAGQGMTLAQNQHWNVDLLTVESRLKTDGVLTNVGTGGTAPMMKDHPKIHSYYICDEPFAGSARAVSLAAMMLKSLDPLHTAAATLANTTSDVLQVAKNALFLDIQMIDPYPLGNSNALNQAGANPSAASDFRFHYPFTNNNASNPAMAWPDYLKWTQSLRPGVPQEVLFQAFGASGTYWRLPSQTELRAQAFMALSQGSRSVNYFLYGNTGSVDILDGLVDINSNPRPNLIEATAINAKINGWMPIYSKLAYQADTAVSKAYIPYANVGPITDTLFSHTFEGATSCFGVPATTSFTPAHGGVYTGTADIATGVNTRAQTVNINWARYPRYSSATLETWVNDGNDPAQVYRVGAAFYQVGTNANYVGVYTPIASEINPGATWGRVTVDLSSSVSNTSYSFTPLIYFGARRSSGSYVIQHLDDVKLTATINAYRPNYQYQGGVAGNFIHQDTGDQYIIVVNTDTVTAKNITVNVTNTSGQPAEIAQNVDSGAIYTLTGGVLTVPNVPPGDGVLLSIDTITMPQARFELNYEEATLATLTDASGSNSPIYYAGGNGLSLTANGIGGTKALTDIKNGNGANYLQISHTATGSNVTMTGWVYIPSGGSGQNWIMSEYSTSPESATTQGGLFLRINSSNHLEAGHMIGATSTVFVTDPGVFPTDQWVFVAVVVNLNTSGLPARQYRLFRGGSTPVATATLAANISWLPAPIRTVIGAHSRFEATNAFAGRVDDTRLYNNALLDEQITAIMLGY